MDLRALKTAKERREAIESNLKINLSGISHFSIDEETVSKKNCENMIGAAQIPLGVAGPLTIKGETVSGDFFLPLATTEGALIASVNRGCKAVADGGVNTASYKSGATRGPVFYTGNLENEKKLFNWIKKNENKIKQTAESTSSHLKFRKLMVRGLANYAFVRFSFDTGSAMGMNMVTIATEKIVELIEKETGVSCISLAGNFDIDKKPAWLNFIESRGYKVWAETVIKQDTLGRVLKTSADKVYDVWLSKNILGSVMSGSMGFNAHFANVAAAFFIATGQDPAHVVEASMGVTTARIVNNKDLYFSIYMPSLMVGTIGGGTSLGTQKEALSILGIKNGESSAKLAEIIGAGVLAGEVSLLSSLAENSLVKAHKKLGRGVVNE